MLDYILSRVVILAFLLLIVGMLVSYQDFLGEFFLAGAAKNVVVDFAEKVRTTVLNISVASESRKIRLPPFLQSGPVRTSYKLILGCKKENDRTVLGIAVKDPRERLLYVKRLDLYIPNMEVNLSIASEVNAGDTVLIKKNVYQREVRVTIGNCRKDVGCNGFVADRECG